MLWTLALVLLILWGLGIVSSYRFTKLKLRGKSQQKREAPLTRRAPRVNMRAPCSVSPSSSL